MFGDRANKDVVMSVINILLPEGKQVDDIEYMPTELQGPMQESKEFQYDFMCTGTDGTGFIVEMQCYPDDFWFRRGVCYASRAYDRQNRKGEEYDVAPVYLIGLMGVPVMHPDPELWKDRYISEYTFREKSTGDLLAETIIIIFVELASFDKTLEECETHRDRMLYILQNIGRFMERSQWLQNQVYDRLFRACEIAAFSEEKRIEYEKDMNDEKRLY
jgi:predicted transposase/invertase (TIGR01784 family)